MFIQLDDGKANEFAKSAGNGRFSGPTSAKNNNALHRHIFMPALFHQKYDRRGGAICSTCGWRRGGAMRSAGALSLGDAQCFLGVGRRAYQRSASDMRKSGEPDLR